jgi:hypothetical protein
LRCAALTGDVEEQSKTEKNINSAWLGLGMEFAGFDRNARPLQHASPALSRGGLGHSEVSLGDEDRSLDALLGEFRRDCAVQDSPDAASVNYYRRGGLDQTCPPAEAPSSAFRADDPGRRYLTHAGVRVRSKAEKIIADLLTDSGLQYLYEPIVRVNGCQFRPDFYLPGVGVFYEHFGYDSESYLRAAETKLVRYHQAGVPLIYTTFNDEPDIEDVIVDKLAEVALSR